jgi:ubiquinone/menaquinone biosynthesis C-methylase UbiE
MSDFYSQVDRSSSPTEAVAWQRRLDSWPSIRAYKERTYDLLSGCSTVLDVGAGPGGDVEDLGIQRCIGFDLSQTMCSEAAASGARVARGDAMALPCRGEAFDGVRADRVVQHVPDPCAAITEMVRATKPGGTLVLADPDQETLLLHVPGAPVGMTDQVKQLRRDVGYRHGRVASRYPSMMRSLDLEHISVDAYAVALTSPNDAFGIEQWPRAWSDQGVGNFSADDLEWWESNLASELPGFLLCLTYLVVAGNRCVRS